MGAGELGGTVALLTYTTTLVKYDRYLSSLMMRGRFGAEDRISTADSFLFERLAAVEPGAVFDFDGKILAEAAAAVMCPNCTSSTANEDPGTRRTAASMS